MPTGNKVTISMLFAWKLLQTLLCYSKMFNAILLIAIYFAFAANASRRDLHKLKETIQPPDGWVLHGPAPPDHVLHLRIGLHQPKFSLLEQHLYAVSDPSSERYGQHLSKEEVEALVAPHPESLSRVDTWLASHGFIAESIDRSPAGDWVSMSVSVRIAEQMLDTKYSVWRHISSGDFLVGTTSYSVPEDLHSHIDIVQPTTLFEPVTASISTTPSVVVNKRMSPHATIPNPYGGPDIDASCNSSVVISCLKQLYNVAKVTAKPAKGNSIGIVGFDQQYANVADLQKFYSSQVPPAVNSSFKVISVNGGLNRQNISLAGDEANLDVQLALGMSFPVPGSFYTVAGGTFFEAASSSSAFIDWINVVLKEKNPPLTISISYGMLERNAPSTFLMRACGALAQLGVRGVSVIVASGDFGVGDNSRECRFNDKRKAAGFRASFPASCPWVTSVGGTEHIPERGQQSSGGGFSEFWERPNYQTAVVTKFLDGLPKGIYEGMYNRKGRAFPDVSAQGRAVKIAWQGSWHLLGGTSASAPIFAGLVALLNDIRLEQGKKPLGFLNPLLYSQGLSGFNDITVGNNPGCGTPGFNATKGWDPVTGLGTPNFGKLRKLLT